MSTAVSTAMSAAMSTAMTDSIQRALDAAVDDGVTPGAAGAVICGDASGDGHVVRVCSGTLNADDPDDARRLVSPSTVYDLASLTKLLVTTVLVADDVKSGVIDLDEAPWSFWPGLTVAHALRHDGGLPAHRPFFETLRRPRERGFMLGRRAGKALVVDAALRTLPEAVPGTRTLYSDIGFIALGALLEDRHATTVDALWTAHPLSAQTAARFVDLEVEGFHASTPLVAPTERCAWRKRIVQGQVHDDNAFVMGGVAGHAGLFASLDDVVTIAQRLLRRLRDPDDVLTRFARDRGPRGERALGFDVVTSGGSTGDVLSSSTVGHLGYTGTSLWLDLERDEAFVLLSNTVHFGRDGVIARNKALRVAFHKAAALR